MKNLYTLMALSVLSVGWLSSCSTLFDVAPKAIYSPIELSKTSIAKVLNKYGGASDSATVTFTVSDPALTYGVIVFYDSISAANLLKRNILAGAYDFYPANADANSSLLRAAKTRINPIRQFQYFVPMGAAKDSTKTYYAQGYVRMKTSPWTHFADLPGYSTQYQTQLFQVEDRLAYVKYNQNYQDFLYLSEYDFTKKSWTYKGKTQNEFCRGGCTYQGTPFVQYTTSIAKGYYTSNAYHLIANTYSARSGNIKYSSGEIILDDKFNYKTIEGISSGVASNPFYITDLQNDTLRVIYGLPVPVFIGNKTLYTSGYYKNVQSGAKTSYTIEDEIAPSVSLTVKNRLIVNSYSTGNTFTVYDISKGQLKKLNSVSLIDQNNLWAPSTQVSRLVGFSVGDYGYVLNNNLNLYKVTLNAKNEPVFSSFYSTWFPANSVSAIKQGLLYKDKANKTQLIFLLNDNELWSFDPEKIDIDFTAYTIVPL